MEQSQGLIWAALAGADWIPQQKIWAEGQFEGGLTQEQGCYGIALRVRLCCQEWMRACPLAAYTTRIT